MKTQSEANGHGNPVIFQVVGYSNSGKTTFLTKLIEKLSSEKMRVATIKHHGHGGQPDLLTEKDSSRHINAGAIASIVEGEGRVILHAEQPFWSLEEQIGLLSSFGSDFILIEGYKHADFPKAILLRDPKDHELVDKINNVVVAYYWDSAIVPDLKRNIPYFHINDEKGQEWLQEYLSISLSKTKNQSK